MKLKVPTLVVAFAAAASAPLEAAVLVNLDATALPTGPLPSWTNTGSLTGNFTSSATVPQVTLSTPGAGGGNPVNAVTFTGTPTFYTGPIAPNAIGGQGARSIEVWALNPSTVDEESLVSWGHRGGPDGTNLSFNWGQHGTWGAVGHWGAPDMPWNPQPVVNQWHHLVYTYDGATVRLYMDGQANNSRALTLNTYQGFNIVIAGQNNNAAPFAPVGFNSTLSIAKVKVHDTSLSLAQVRSSYNADAALFGKATVGEVPTVNTFTANPVYFLPGQPTTLSWNVSTVPGKPLTAISINNGAPAISGNTGSVQVNPTGVTVYTLTATNSDGSATGTVTVLPRSQPLVPRHRWSFNSAAATGSNGTALPDSIGGANAFIRTNGAINTTLTGTQVSMPGGASGTAPYIDLPNGIVSTRSGDATWEGWMTIAASQNWSRIFDFGNCTAAAEIFAPGGAGNGDEYLVLSAQVGGTQTQNRFGIRKLGVETSTDPIVPYVAGQEFHYAVTFRMGAGSGGLNQLRYFRNGALMATVDAAHQLSAIKDVNNWLGRSNWTADNNLQGSYNEFRVYDGAMTAEDVNASMTAGPDVTVLPTPLHLDLFTAEPAVINPGGSTTLYWAATSPGPGTTATITPNIGALANPLNGSVVVSPSATTTYTYTLTNGSQTRTATQKVVVAYVAPDAPVADSQTIQVPFGTAKAVTLTATDPDDEPLTWTVVTQPAHGTLTGTAPNLTYTPATGYTGTDEITFKVNDGQFDSNVASVGITVCPATAPTDIVLSDSQIKTDDTVGTMIARLTATDDGCPETHTFAFVAGAGDTNNSDFTIVGNQLISNRNFSGALNQSVSVRVRVTDQTGLSYERVFSFVVGPPDLHVKINEIFYNSPNNRVGAEFIELYNPFPAAVDVSGWRFSDGVDYIFPAGSSIPAGGYLVVAQSPAAVQALWGATALGPWSGGLSSDGDTVTLRDNTNAKVDEVTFGINTPWPVAPNGDGPSLELVNPTLDNDLGGNWKAATVSTTANSYVTRGSAGWRYRPGNSEASNPVTDWRLGAFTEDATWKTGTAPVGLFKINSNASSAVFAETGVTLGTQLTAAVTGVSDMATFVAAGVESTTNFTVNYQSVFFRKPFTVTGTPPAALYLRVMHNDAAIVYINGTEVARFGFAEGAPANPPFNYQSIYERGNDPWSEVILTNAASYLTTGTNTIAIQGWAKNPRLRGGPNGQDDANLYNVFDFAIDAELATVSQYKATPGTQNSVYSATAAGPAVRNVTHTPEQPDSGDPIVVSARISDRQGLGSVVLKYQVVSPGSFIPAEEPRTNAEILANIVANPDYPKLPNAAFENAANWVTVNMTDAGAVSGDTEGDGVFTAVIPPQNHRKLVRYRIFATDLAGNTAQVPSLDDPSKNFAAFVYNGLPGYTNGTYSSGPTELSTLPVYHWIMRPADFDKLMAYSTVDQFANDNALSTLTARRYYNFEGAMVYDGKVYDHVQVRLRGGNSRYNGAGKRHFRFKFPKGYAFEAKDNKGNRYPRDWEQMLFNKQFGNKGDYDWGLPYVAGEKLWGLQGVPMPENQWVHFRVIRGANQAADGTNGNDFFGLYQALELPDGKNFLTARNLPKGNFYKMSDFIQNGEMDERYQAAGAPDFAEDFDNIRYNVHPTAPQATIEKFVNMPLWYKYNAVQEAIRHYDIFIEPTGRHRVKNLYWYFHPGALNPDGSRVNPLGQCWFMPYDWDASFGPNWNNGYDMVNNSIYNRNAFPDSPTWTGIAQDRSGMMIQHRNAFRELRDLVFHRNDGGTGPVDYILDDAASVLSAFWEADAARWPGTTVGAASWRSMPDKVTDMKNFCFTGWSTIAGEPVVGAGGRAAYLDSISDTIDAGQLPATPAATYTGTGGYPVDGLTFSASAFSDPQGGAFAAIQWRAGEIAAPTATTDRIYEATEVWGSGELAGPSTNVAIPAGALRAGHTYRVRVRYKDVTGRFSHWSAPVQFTASEGTYDAVLTENLYISELMYKPAPPTLAQSSAPNFWTENDFEYVELTNRSNVLTLDLTSVRLTKGVDFDFAGSAITSLAPGASVLVVRNIAAFTDRYGAGKPVAGAWQAGQSLANGGEQFKVSFGAGNAIHDIVYDDASPWPTDADSGGVSMIYAGPNAVAGQADPQADGANWRASSVTGGTPGTEEFVTLARWMNARGLTDPAADPLNTGWNNQATFAFGRDLHPATPVSAIVTATGQRYLEFTYVRRRGTEGVTYEHEYSTSLQPNSWNFTDILISSLTNNEDGTETLTLRLNVALDAPGSGTRYFLRARAVTP